MKKVYEKPMIAFENFSMCTNIAAGCENKTNLPSQDLCGIFLPGIGKVFASGMTGCEDRAWQRDEEFNGICYHTPEESSNLFAS